MNSRLQLLDHWETHQFDGAFTVDMPLGVKPVLSEQHTIVTFPLPSTPTSELTVSIHPSPDDRPLTQMLLRDEIDRFMHQIIGASNISFETPADFDKDGFIGYQSVGVVDDQWCLARIYGRRNGHLMLLFHWVGQELNLSQLVLPIFVSVDPQLDE